MCFFTMPSKTQRMALVGDASAKDIVKGHINPVSRSGIDENLKYGFEVIYRQDGKVSFKPNSTVADHALIKALET